MPRFNRYFPVSQDLNDDPEVWEFTQKFGDRALRTFLQVLAILDRNENRWPLTGDWVGTMGRKLRQLKVRDQVADMVDREWLIAYSPSSDEPFSTDPPMVRQPAAVASRMIRQWSADTPPLILSARNYWKFHKRQEPKNKNDGSPLTLPSLPNITNPPIVPHGDDGFLEFWNAYPQKVGKTACQRIWQKLRPNHELKERILAKIKQQEESARWKRDGGQYIPNPATWLNQGRWDDEVDDFIGSRPRRRLE